MQHWLKTITFISEFQNCRKLQLPGSSTLPLFEELLHGACLALIASKIIMYVSVWGFIHMSACTLGGQKRALGPSEMELQVVELLVIGS